MKDGHKGIVPEKEGGYSFWYGRSHMARQKGRVVGGSSRKGSR